MIEVVLIYHSESFIGAMKVTAFEKYWGISKTFMCKSRGPKENSQEMDNVS